MNTMEHFKIHRATSFFALTLLIIILVAGAVVVLSGPRNLYPSEIHEYRGENLPLLLTFRRMPSVEFRELTRQLTTLT